MADPRATLRRMSIADAHWRAALGDSAYAPPDDAFADRLRAIAHAARDEAVGLREADADPVLHWQPLKAPKPVSLSPELHPDANRPGSHELWQSYDEAVDQIADAQAGDQHGPIADGFQALAEVLERLAVSVDEERGVAASQRRRRAG